MVGSGGFDGYDGWLASNGFVGSDGFGGADGVADLDDFDGSTRRHCCESLFVAQVVGCCDI